MKSTEKILQEGRVVQRVLRMFLILSSDMLGDLWREMNLNVESRHVAKVRRAARVAYASLMGGAEAIYDVDSSLESAEEGWKAFLQDIAAECGEALAAEIRRWSAEEFTFGIEDGGLQRYWSMWLLHSYHARDPDELSDLSESRRQQLRCAIEREILATLEKVSRLEAEVHSGPRSDWDRRLAEHVAPSGQSMEGVTVVDGVSSTLSKCSWQRLWRTMRFSSEEIEALSRAYLGWARKNHAPAEVPLASLRGENAVP